MAVEVGAAYISILPETSKIGPGIRKALGDYNPEGEGKKQGKRFSDGFRGGVESLRTSALAAGAAISGIVASSVKLESQFSSTMNVIGATLQSPKGELDELRQLALDMGAATSFSASEASDAMESLAKGGLDAATIKAGALEGTLTLAAAGGTSLASAADIAVNSLNGFNISGDKMNQVAAALAGGANASTASVESLGQALAQVGPGAVNAGLDLNETVAALAAFDNAGIKGSDAGTSLKTMLQSLVPDTKRSATAMEELGLNFVDAQGNFLPLTEVAGQLQGALSGLSESARTTALNDIFGSDASRAAAVLMNEGAAGIQSYIDATKDLGAADDAANARMRGTAGALERLGGAWETFRLEIGLALAPTIVTVADNLGRLTDFLSDNMNTVLIAGGIFAGLVGAVLALNAAFAIATTIQRTWAVGQAVVTAVTTVATSAKTRYIAALVAERAIMIAHRGVVLASVAAQWLLNAAMAANPIGLVIAGIAALVAGLVWFFTQTEVGRKVWTVTWNAIKIATKATVDWIVGTAWPALQAAWQGISNGAIWLYEKGIKPAFDFIVKAIQGAWVVIRVIFVTWATGWSLLWQGIMLVWSKTGAPVFAAIRRVISSAFGWIQKNVFAPFMLGLRIMGLVMVSFWKNQVVPAWNGVRSAIGSAWSWVNKNVFQPMRTGVRALGAGAAWLWRNAIVPAWNGIRSAIGGAWNWINTKVFLALRAGVTAVGSAFSWLNRKAVQPAWSGIKSASTAAWNWVRDKVFGALRTGLSALGKAFDATRKFIASVWGKIRSAAAKPVNFIIETVYTKGIKKTWDKIAGSVGLDLKLPSVSPIAYANGGIENHRAQIARPGAMRLWAEPETGGEAYIPLASKKRGRSTQILRTVADRFGYNLTPYANGGFFGDAWDKIKDVSSSFLSGPANLVKKVITGPMNTLLGGMGGGSLGKIAAEMPRKAVGGLIEKAKDFASSMFGGGQDVALSGGGRFAGGPVMGWQNMWNIVKNAFPGATLNSAFRPGAITAVGTPSFHGQGRAIDVTPSMAIFNWLAKTFPNSSELIYSPAGNRQLYMGRKTMFGEPTRGDHWDHVHWAMANGGLLFDNGGVLPNKGIGVNKSGKPEAFLTNSQSRALKSGIIASQAARASNGNGSKPMYLVLEDGRQLRGYVTEAAEDVYSGEQRFRGVTGRMR